VTAPADSPRRAVDRFLAAAVSPSPGDLAAATPPSVTWGVHQTADPEVLVVGYAAD
jgi:hypothetical protein